MALPVMLLCGAAGSGKDTVAEILERRCGAASLAQADPMKRIAQELFDFKSTQLWGPSEERERLVLVTPLSLRDATPRIEVLMHEVGFKPTVDSKYTWDGAIDMFRRWFEAQSRIVDNQLGKIAARGVLQTFGTEFGREVLGRDVWSRWSLATAERLLNGGFRYYREHGAVFTPGHPPAPLGVIRDGRFINEILNAKRFGALTVLVTGRKSQAVGGVAGHSSEAELNTIPEHFYDAMLHNAGDLADLELAIEEVVYARFRTAHFGEYMAGMGREATHAKLWRHGAAS